MQTRMQHAGRGRDGLAGKGRGGKRRGGSLGAGGRGRSMAELEPATSSSAVVSFAGASRAGSLCDAVGKQSFEACPFYLGEVHAPRTIHAVFPRALAIAVLRNPRERTISAFNDYVRHGRVSQANGTSAGMESLVIAKVAAAQQSL